MKLGLMLFDTTYGRTRINQSVSYGDGPQNEAERQWHDRRNPPKAMDCPSEISSLTATSSCRGFDQAVGRSGDIDSIVETISRERIIARAQSGQDHTLTRRFTKA